MSGSLEEAYVAVERAYGQGDFATALQLAEALQAQVPAGRPDLLDQRLDLLLGHIHLYGLNQPNPAATAYAAVLERCAEPSYRELASQGLELSRQQVAAAAVAVAVAGAPPISAPQAAESTVSPVSPVSPISPISPVVQPMDQLPATPWLSQLQDPQQALDQIQAAWATTAPTQPAAAEAAAPSATPESDSAETPWQPEPSAESEPQPDPIPAVISLEDGESSLALQPLDQSGGSSADDADALDQPAAPDPEAIIPVVVTVEDDTPATGTPEIEEPVVATQEPAASRFSEEEWADLSRGLLLVELSSPQGD